MDYARYIKTIGAIVSRVFLASLVAEERTVPAQSYQTQGVADEEAAEKCASQLNLIYNALRKYIEEHQAYPRWLSDLTPDYLNNPGLLICPYVSGSGNVKSWWQDLKVFRVHNDPRPTSYGYEFCLEEIGVLPGTTVRAYKQRQMEIVGTAVPIVRCTLHTPALNLAYDGAIYRSGLDWEDQFAKNTNDSAIFQAALPEDVARFAVRPLVRARAVDTSSRCIDLSGYYTGTLFHLSNMQYDGTVIEFMTNGVCPIQGVSYDVRGLVHLTARNFVVPFPHAVEQGISLHQKCSRVHLLHGTVGEAAEGAIVARYIFHLENGHKFQMPIRYGEDVQTRFFDPDDPPGSKESQPAWVSPPDRVGSSGHALRLYVNSWSNPEPASIVQKVEFISEMTASAPFLVALTTE